ncbi:unnamed protein product [Rotaria socialis]|uniref:Uncharacterized protein n=1 Tax=Rotaria socialis TaxID=392032 RepID=A0A821UKE5_9BILA|nr:unnamed protein product [Rotaria socialis]CAF4891781.1 unnamed protein product [Rotaria socialis]
MKYQLFFNDLDIENKSNRGNKDDQCRLSTVKLLKSKSPKVKENERYRDVAKLFEDCTGRLIDNQHPIDENPIQREEFAQFYQQ